MPKIAGWGNYPQIYVHKNNIINNIVPDDKRLNSCIARGLGRSYGDASLSENIFTDKNKNVISFDNKTGILNATAGLTISNLNSITVPHGWIVPVSPGTSNVTLGGMIASDVHGKNHHKNGSFSNFVHEIKLFIGSDFLSVKKGSDLFKATLGGMGLTGIITEVKIQLRKISSSNIFQKNITFSSIDSCLDLFTKFNLSSYSVCWLDFLDNKSETRGVFSIGEHADDSFLYDKKNFSINIPFKTPAFILNDKFLRVFNKIYLKKNKDHEHLVDFKKFFYPLDRIHNWNNLYGLNGFIQFQFVLPEDDFLRHFNYVKLYLKNNNIYPYLAVLKKFGPGNDNYLSFPIQGYTLALDFKNNTNTRDLLINLSDYIVANGGRFYLTKDSILTEQQFKKSYLDWKKLQSVREKYNLFQFKSLLSRRLGLNR